MWERAVGDIGTIVKAVPQMPAMLAKEAWSLKDLPRELGEAATSGDLSKIAEVPGIRLLPGAYIAAEGREALKHPVFAALDIAPYAKWATKGAQLPKFAGGKFIEGGVPRAARQIRKTERGADILNTLDRARMRLPIAREARGTARISARANRQLATDAEQAYRTIGDTKRQAQHQRRGRGATATRWGSRTRRCGHCWNRTRRSSSTSSRRRTSDLGTSGSTKGCSARSTTSSTRSPSTTRSRSWRSSTTRRSQNENPAAATRALEAWETEIPDNPTDAVQPRVASATTRTS